MENWYFLMHVSLVFRVRQQVVAVCSILGQGQLAWPPWPRIIISLRPRHAPSICLSSSFTLSRFIHFQLACFCSLVWLFFSFLFLFVCLIANKVRTGWRCSEQLRIWGGWQMSRQQQQQKLQTQQQLNNNSNNKYSINNANNKP